MSDPKNDEQKKLLAARTIAHLAVITEDELEHEIRRYGRKKSDRGMSFPLWYTTSLRRAMKDRCRGADRDTAAQRIRNFPDNLKPTGERLLANFDELAAANDDISLMFHSAPKGFNAEIAGVRLQPRQDLVGRCKDGRLFLGYLHVVDQPLSQAEVDLLISLTSYVAEARGVEVDVAILDVPRKRIIRQTAGLDRSELERHVRRAKRRAARKG